VNQASEGWSKTKAAYRFFDNDRVKARNILDPHRQRTKFRVQAQTEPILVVQDTTFINYSHMACSEDLGPIGKLHNSSMGLVMHTSFAFSTRALPLGIVDQVIWARKKEEHGKAAQRKVRLLEQKESYRWIQALRSYHRLLVRAPMVVTVCDREADIYDIFQEAKLLNTKYLIRAKSDRNVDNNQKLWDFMQQQSVVEQHTIHVPEHENQPQRKAEVEVRFSAVPLKYPADRPRSKRQPDIEAFAVYVREINPPPTAQPVDWMLLTNVAVASPEDAIKRIEWYKIRWSIEIFHRILKSGCHVEHARFEKNHRRIAYLTLKSIIAWKLLLLTHFHRIAPDDPATNLMSSIECAALYAAIHNSLPTQPIEFTARQGIRWLGQLGGFLGRKWDKNPGPTSLWRGWQRLQDYTTMFQITSLNLPSRCG
jgi:hypothetical protein